MPQENLYNLIVIDKHAATPKYLQVINSIIKAIEDGKISAGYCMPSINDLSNELNISRDTSIHIYKELKKMNIITSFPGKGYFINEAQVSKRIKIFLLFNKLSTHKKIIYDSFAAALGNHAAIDFYIYNNSFQLFKMLLNNRRQDYSYYVIIPHFIEGGEQANEVINELPKDKLILMDKLLPGVHGRYGAVYENFEKDIYNALKQALPHLSKYLSINMIFPEYTYHPQEILTGFYNFCYEYAFTPKVIDNISKKEIKKGEVYISLREDDLVILIERVLLQGLKVGEEVGVISYNETAIKKIILNGITTISTDFKMIGEQAAALILNNSTEHIEAAFHLTLRRSL
jgi:DNA-binding transcriptional regulator YhcF (GntR family)